jgi:hypothetical protein
MDDAFSTPVFTNLFAVHQRGEGEQNGLHNQIPGTAKSKGAAFQFLPGSCIVRTCVSYFLKSFLLHRTVFVNTLNA